MADFLEAAVNDAVMTEEEQLAVAKRFEEQRDEWAMAEMGRFGLHYFKVTVRGAGKGDKAYAELRGYASGQRAQQWCRKYHLFETADFAVSLFSEGECSVLVKAWCEQRAYWYSLWLMQEEENYEFTQADIEGLPEPKEMAELLPTLTAKQRNRVDVVFAKVPRL